jgi:hypothetical protein
LAILVFVGDKAKGHQAELEEILESKETCTVSSFILNAPRARKDIGHGLCFSYSQIRYGDQQGRQRESEESFILPFYYLRHATRMRSFPEIMLYF